MEVKCAHFLHCCYALFSSNLLAIFASFYDIDLFVFNNVACIVAAIT